MDLAIFQDDPLGLLENSQVAPPTRYRANRKKFFLTYSRCDKTPEEIYSHLSSIATIHKYLIAKELHQDGHPHIHAYVEFVDKQDFKNSRWADFQGYHPNDGGKVRNEMAVTKYCQKDGNFISNFYKLNPWSLALDPEKSYEDSIEIIKKERPEKYILYSEQIKKTIRSEKRRKLELKEPLIDLTDWQREVMSMLLLEPTPRRIIWIWSLESSMGKTTFKKYVQFHLQQDFLLGSMKINDTMYAYESQKVIWFDIPRQHPLDAELTSQLETLSDGGVVGSSKYKSSNKIVDAHIVVTTNRPPPDDKLPNRIIAFQAYINLSPL